jgi:hypothetical protein
MFIVLSMIVSASGPVELVGIVPDPGLLAASAISSSAAAITLRFNREHSLALALGPAGRSASGLAGSAGARVIRLSASGLALAGRARVIRLCARPEWQSASQAASDDWPYMKPTSCGSKRSWPK